MIIIPFGSNYLVLEDDEFEAARQRGQRLMPPIPPSVNGAVQIVDAAGAETAAGVPSSWWLEAARRGDVPHIRRGKYVRFDLVEVIETARQRVQ